MSLESRTTDHSIEVLSQSVSVGPSLGTRRHFSALKTVLCHVRPLPGMEIERMRLRGMDITHNLWFSTDPEINETDRINWNGTIMRLVGPVINCHGQNRLWLCQAKAMTHDNEEVPEIA